MKKLKRLISTVRLSRLHDSKGVTLLLVTVLMFVFIGMTALAIDVGHLYVVRAELQNAADAGALWAANELYNDSGTVIQESANQAGFDAATQNKALTAGGAIPVNVNPLVDVQRGHWSFTTKTFTPNDSTILTPLQGRTTEDLDTDPEFINAVRVVAWRQDPPAASFFARIFGYPNFTLSAEAIGWVGFAGTLYPGDVDAPIAICSQSLTGCECGAPCPYDCNIGYMLSDGQDKNTAAWTNFSTSPNSLCENSWTANSDELRDLLTCEDANPNPIELGDFMGATNGVNDTIIGSPTKDDLVGCWVAAADTDGDGIADVPWQLMLPVVNCPDFHVSNCMEVCGAVVVNIVWILEKANDIDAQAPYRMGDWNWDGAIELTGQERWDEFVTVFDLRTPNGDLATVANGGFMKKSIYFLPDCTPHPLTGLSNGTNYGVLAAIPKLVK